MSEDFFGTPEADFCPFYAQAQSALMALDAAGRGALPNDASDQEYLRLQSAYGVRTYSPVSYAGVEHDMTPTDHWGDPTGPKEPNHG